MNKKIVLWILLLVFLFPTAALAQDYYFSLDKEVVHAFWNEDGTLTLDYTFVFTNQPSGHPIEYVDVGVPNGNFQVENITAEINGQSLDFISRDEYQGSGTGFAVGLGSKAIPPGGRGSIHVRIPNISGVLRPDTQEDDYASAVFSPTWFGKEYVTGTTDLTMVYHLPPGVEPDEPRWHSAPENFPSSPVTSIDTQGRVTYTWRNREANAYTQYKFGASFPSNYVPASTISKPSIWEQIGIPREAVVTLLCMTGFGILFVLIIVFSVVRSRKRKLEYLPPKIEVEGHGIKRGLTAIEAAVLLEKPVDKVFTMILFSILQKNAGEVTSRDPLEIKFTDPLPNTLRNYEKQFVEAFQEEGSERIRKIKLQDMMIELIESVGEKMKGFSHRETVNYYRQITKKAWKQVEDADTPEVKSEKFSDHIGWTMLDEDFEDRTQEVFRRGPVFVPVWWHRYDPTYRRSGRSVPRTSNRPAVDTGTGKGVSLPNLPGGEFAASMVNGIENFSSDVVGNITSFTNRITQKTNPVPKSSSSSYSGGGGSCACACACAGCACACAGGGR